MTVINKSTKYDVENLLLKVFFPKKVTKMILNINKPILQV